MRLCLVDRGGGSVIERARRVEDLGYAELLFPDHVGMADPFAASAAAAAATRTLGVGTNVVNVALRPVGLLAQAAATVDVIAEGRFRLGLGAGYAKAEHDAVGVPFPDTRHRLDRLDVATATLQRLFTGEQVTEDRAGVNLDGLTLQPRREQSGPRLALGGNGDRMLDIAARHADLVSLTGFTATPAGPELSHFTTAGLADRVEHTTRAAGAHRPDLELLIQYAKQADDAREAITDWPPVRDGALTADEALASPFVLVGSRQAITDRLTQLHEEFGVTSLAILAPEHDDELIRPTDLT